MRIRFIAKPVGTKWRVYDCSKGSYPYQTAELGKVKQDLANEALAIAEAERLQQLVMSVKPAKAGAGDLVGSPAPQAAADSAS